MLHKPRRVSQEQGLALLPLLLLVAIAVLHATQAGLRAQTDARLALSAVREQEADELAESLLAAAIDDVQALALAGGDGILAGRLCAEFLRCENHFPRLSVLLQQAAPGLAASVSLDVLLSSEQASLSESQATQRGLLPRYLELRAEVSGAAQAAQAAMLRVGPGEVLLPGTP